jgi:hypothetical protein
LIHIDLSAARLRFLSFLRHHRAIQAALHHHRLIWNRIALSKGFFDGFTPLLVSGRYRLRHSV